MSDETRLVAIHSGGDWFDASARYIMLQVGVSMDAVKAAWREWYRLTYSPQLAAGEKPEFFTLDQFAIRFHGAVEADIEIYDDT